MVQIWILGYKSLSLRKFINFLEARSFRRLIDKKELKKMVQEEEQELEELLMSHGSSVVGRISVDR